MSQKELEEILTCAVCLDIFTKPTSINCGHTFCLDCLISIQNQAKSVNFPECPLCKQKFRSKKSFYWKQSIIAMSLLDLYNSKYLAKII